MNSITLTATTYLKIGKCNSNELYKIIEKISPEVIFEELSSNSFDEFYNKNLVRKEPLEVSCIKKKLQKNFIKHIPVDIDIDKNLSNDQIEFIFNTFLKYKIYKKLDDEQCLMTEQEGFD